MGRLSFRELPGGAVVAGKRDPALGAEIELAAAGGVLPHRVEVDVARQAAVEPLPGAAEVGRLPEVGSHVVEAVGVHHQVGGGGVEAGGLEHRHRAPLGQAGNGGGDLAPALAAVLGDVHPPVVAAGPDQVLAQRRLGEGEHRAVGLDAGVVAGDRAARPLLFRLVVARQVRADGGPGLAAVGGAEDDVGGVVDHLGIVRRDGDGGGPLEAVAHGLAAVARGIVRPGADGALLARAVVVAGDVAQILAGVDDGGIGRIGDHPAGLAAADAVPEGIGQAAAGQRVARSLAGADVLHRAGHPEGHPVVGRHMVELADRQRRSEPALAAVGRDVDAAVVARDHPPGVERVDPQVVVVAMIQTRGGEDLEGPAAVDAFEQRHVGHPDLLRIDRIHRHGRVVPGALPELAIGRGQRPALAAVVRAVEPALLRLDQRIDPPAVRRRHGDADLAPDAFRQTAPGELLPGVAAVARHPEAAARTAARHLPGAPPRLPQAGEDDVGIGRIESDGRGARVRILLQHLLPGLAAVPWCGRRRARGWDRRRAPGPRRRPRRRSWGGRRASPICPSCFQT